MTLKANRRTKIVATVGPASESADMIAKLIGAGVNIFRLNFSHGTAEQHAQVARRIRKQASIAGNYVGILADLQGPKIRISSFRNDSVELSNGDRFRLDLALADGEGDVSGVGLDYDALCSSVFRGDILLLDDGRIRLRVDDVDTNAVDCTVVVGGKLGSRKGINRLGGGLAAPALTAKDLTDINSLAGRQEIWSRALYAIQDFPLTGTGPGLFRELVPPLYPLFRLSSDKDIAHAHNQWLQTALDFGLPGLIAYLALWLGLVGCLWRTGRSPLTPLQRTG